MDILPYKCGFCNKAYKNKCSLQRHKTEMHNHRNFLCPKCNIYFKRTHDLKRHNLHAHGPKLVLKKSPSNVTAQSHSIAKTTEVLEGTTSLSVLQQDLALSPDSDEDTDFTKVPEPYRPAPVTSMRLTQNGIEFNPKKSVATNTDISNTKGNTSVSCNTSPMVCLDMKEQSQVYLNLLGTKAELGPYKIPKQPYNTQLGALRAYTSKNAKTQTKPQESTSKDCCSVCTHQDHLINQRWDYWVEDFKKNGKMDVPKTYQSRETYKRLSLTPPNPQYRNKMARFDLTPTSPKESRKPEVTPQAGPSKPRESRPIPKRERPPKAFPDHPTMVINKEIPASTVRRPGQMLLNQSAYENICSRISTRPKLITPKRSLNLPEPREGQWDYLTNNM